MLTVLLLALGAAPARAAWTATSSAAKGYSQAKTVGAGNTPSPSVSGRNVTLSWTASTLSGGTAVDGYIVTRYPAAGGAGTTPNANCNGTVTGLTCTANAVPSGSWKYTVTPAKGNWRGTESAQSSTVNVVSPSLTITSSTTVTSLPATVTANLAGYITGETITYRLDDPTTGTVLSATTTPSTIPTNGTASASITLPTGVSNASHTIYAVGNQGDTAGASITVNTCTAGSTTVNPDADNTVQQDKPSNGATATTMDVKADTSNTKMRRAVVHFTLPTIPSGCTVTSATFRLYTTAGVTGRTINVFEAASAWTESGVLWGNQPGTTGTAATAASAASGYVNWTVTTQVQDQYSGNNYGFSIRDSNELSGTTLQTFSTRESSTNKPELTVNYG